MLFETRLSRVGFAVIVNTVFIIAAVAVGLSIHSVGVSTGWSYVDGLVMLVVVCLAIDLLIWRKMPRNM